MLSLESFVLGDEVGSVAILERRQRPGHEDLAARSLRGLAREPDRQRGELAAPPSQARLLEGSPMGAEGVRGQDLRPGRDLVLVNRGNELRRFDERPRAPERQASIGAAPLELRSRCGVKKDRRTAPKPPTKSSDTHFIHKK